MLKSEIEPFAKANMTALDEMYKELIDVYNNSPSDSELTSERLDKMLKTIDDARRSFYRFQVCMIDEHNMKERAYKQALHCRLHHKDQ